jgi:hypothetical protein
MESLHIKLGIGFQVNRYLTCDKGVTLTSLLFNVMTNFLRPQKLKPSGELVYKIVVPPTRQKNVSNNSS